MIVEFVFIASVSQFPQDVFERVKDNTPAIHSQVTWHFINKKEILLICCDASFREKFCFNNYFFQLARSCAIFARMS